MSSHTEHILSPETQATLLLCGRFSDNGNQQVKPLSTREYNLFITEIGKEGLRPSDMLENGWNDRVQTGKLDPERLRSLLDRGVELGFAVEEWARQGIWILSQEDDAYPETLRSRLKNLAPPLLFGAGNQEMLNLGGLGIVGSRDADDEALHFTREISERCAHERLVVISGGARGVDREAMHTALTSGGMVLGVLPEGIAKTAVTRANRAPIAEGVLTLVSPYHVGA